MRFCHLKHLILKAAAMLLLAAFSSCSPSQPKPDFVFINGGEPETLDPALMTTQIDMRIGQSLFEGLLRVNEKGEPEPGMAERWEISDDQKTYTFHLRKNALWSHGRPVTAHDFYQSWKRVLEPETAAAYASQLYFIEGAEDFATQKNTDFSRVGLKLLDDYTLKVTLKNPTPFFLNLCSFITLAPVPIDLVEKHGTAWIKPENIASNGAFVMTSWRIDDRIRLEKNPVYWDHEQVKMGSIEVKVGPDPNTAINFFLSGEADLIMDKDMIPSTIIQQIKQKPWYHSSPFFGTFFMRFNTTKAPFDNAKVRKAFALAIDRQRITEKITCLGEKPTTTFVLEGSGNDSGYRPPEIDMDYNPEKARQLLAEAGFPEGRGFPQVSYLYIHRDLERYIAVELQEMWKQNLNVHVRLEKQESKVFNASMRRLEYDMCRSSWVGDYNDPNTFLELFQSDNGNNRTGWKNTQYDSLIQKASSETELVTRYNFFQQAERYLLESECVIAPLYHYVGVQFYHAHRLGGIQGNMTDEHPLRCMFLKTNDSDQPSKP